MWCQDEAGPYQAIPRAGASWQPEGTPTCRPHEYIRGGTAKLLTLFRPHTGEVRACGVKQATNAILHPWLKGELEAILEELSSSIDPLTIDPLAPGRRWSDWGWSEETVYRYFGEAPPPVRMVMIWDNLAGHYTTDMVDWCYQRGIALLYTPLGGSWLNLAESVQRILVRRALDGQHLETDEALIHQLEAVVRGWNHDPTPFEWGGKRWERRQRARERRYALAASGGYTRRPIPRRPSLTPFQRLLHLTSTNGSCHDN